MYKTEIETKLKSQNYVDPGMIKAAFNFWYSDNDHIRSPFPEYIREQLQKDATDKLLAWCSKISDKAKKDINDEILAEKFEEIVFECALNMVLTEDEKLTIRYPFLLRIGDTIKVKNIAEDKAASMVIDRWYEKKGDNAFMKVKLRNIASGEKWETEFELPE